TTLACLFLISLIERRPTTRLINTIFFYGYGAHRDLHSFPTRRSSDLLQAFVGAQKLTLGGRYDATSRQVVLAGRLTAAGHALTGDRKSTRLNSSHGSISYAVFCLKKKKINTDSSHRSTLRHEQVQLSA